MAQDHKHGSMDSSTQEKTYEGFLRLTKIVVIVIVAILLLLALFRA